MNYPVFKSVATATTIVALAAFGQSVAAADYFEGRTITVQVPSGSSGTYHVCCQIVQRNIARHIPGNPTTVVQNRPGGGAKSAAIMVKGSAEEQHSYRHDRSWCHYHAVGAQRQI